MERYSNKSKIKKIKVQKDGKEKILYAEIIKEPENEITAKEKKILLQDLSELIKKSWGKFPNDYLVKSIVSSEYLLIFTDKDNLPVGLIVLDKLILNSRIVYSLGITVIAPSYRGHGLLEIMYRILSKKVLLEIIFSGKLSVEILFFTPNIKTILFLEKIADFIYPNPYKINLKTGKLELADEETWRMVNAYLIKTGYADLDLNRAGCVLKGFYSDKRHLIQDGQYNIDYSNKGINLFNKNYLKPGNEVIVRTKINILKLLFG